MMGNRSKICPSRNAGAQKENGRVLCAAAFAVFLASFAALAQNGLSYEYYSRYNNNSLGEIVGISVDPEKPLVMEDVVATIAVRNLQDYQNDFVLRTFVSKDGRVVDENEITFSLNAKKEMSVTLEFSPTKLGTYNVVAKLFDKYKTLLYSEKVVDVEVISEIGPFDVQLDVLSRTIKPGYEIPLLLTMKNMGIKGTDVKAAITMDCAAQGQIYKDFSVFLGGNGSADKTVVIPACNEEGYHEITAKIILFDSVLAQSTSSVFINSTQRDIYIRTPDFIEVRRGVPKVFDIYIRNDDDKATNDVQVMISGLPQEWVSTTPKRVASIAPAESAIFIVNLSVPVDAAVAEYPFTISVGGDELLEQKEAVMKVLEAAVEAQVAAGPQATDGIDMASFEAAAAAAAIVLAVVVFWKFKKSQRSNSKKIILMKVKDTIRANE